MAVKSKAIKNVIEDTDIDAPILLSNVSSKNLAKVIEYCKFHLQYKMNEEKSMAIEDKMNIWDEIFLK